jgi:hypothetical protein
MLESGSVPNCFAVGYTGLKSYGNGRYLPLDRGMQEATPKFLQYAEATETFWMSDKEEIINLQSECQWQVSIDAPYTMIDRSCLL